MIPFDHKYPLWLVEVFLKTIRIIKLFDIKNWKMVNR
jgi:hypothetical protein